MHKVTSNMGKKGLYARALTEFGAAQQRLMLIEEIGELLNAFAKLPRGRATEEDVLEELADVSIMIEQMALLYGGLTHYNLVRRQKLKRLKERLACDGLILL